MVLETWMVVMIIAMFGLCAWFSTASGRKSGGLFVLDTLVVKRIIMIKDGELVPYSVWNEKKAEKSVDA